MVFYLIETLPLRFLIRYRVKFWLDSNPVPYNISSGVFMTEDGQTWKPLNQFKGFVGPVYYFNDHYIFVGNYRSQNGGKTFDQYIQIDKISQAIRNLGFEVKKVKIKSYQSSKTLQCDDRS